MTKVGFEIKYQAEQKNSSTQEYINGSLKSAPKRLGPRRLFLFLSLSRMNIRRPNAVALAPKSNKRPITVILSRLAKTHAQDAVRPQRTSTGNFCRALYDLWRRLPSPKTLSRRKKWKSRPRFPAVK